MDIPECGPDDLAVSLRWERDGDELRGEVVAENVGRRVCRLGNKPTVQPLDLDGEPLPTEFLVTMELRLPPHVDLRPGQRARAHVSWGSWCGAPASSRAVVGWQGGSTVVDVQGPCQPEYTGDPQNLSSGWFELIE